MHSGVSYFGLIPKGRGIYVAMRSGPAWGFDGDLLDPMLLAHRQSLPVLERVARELASGRFWRYVRADLRSKARR